MLRMLAGSNTTSEPMSAARFMEMLPAALYVCAADGRILHCNRRAIALWGRTPVVGNGGELFCGAHRLLGSDGTPLTPVDAPVAQALRTGAPIADALVYFEREHGERIPVLITVAPLAGENGEAVGAIACMQDVSATHVSGDGHAGAELREARAQLEEANRARMEFLAIMSHELRTPLNAIAGYTELIALGIHGSVTERQLQALNRIRQSQEQLLALINDVLSYARIESGGLTSRTTDVNMAEALLAADALARPWMGHRGIKFRYAGCDAHIVARADPDRVHQIIVNLLSNAAKFTPAGRHVTLDCTTADGRVIVRLTDDGYGIPPDKLESIFDPFVQLSPALTRSEQGVGLGLAISRDLARAMGGDLTVESTHGHGSTFQLSLPMA